MKKEYQTFTPDIKNLVENEEVKLTIKDLNPGTAKYGAKIVKAILASDPTKLPHGDVLHIRSWTGVLYPQTWAIKIIEELEETEAGVPHGETIGARK
jgi:hypothetical protein